METPFTANARSLCHLVITEDSCDGPVVAVVSHVFCHEAVDLCLIEKLALAQLFRGHTVADGAKVENLVRVLAGH